MVEGGHILCSPKTIDEKNTVSTDNEVKIEEDKFKAMCLLKSSDQVRFEDLQDKLCHSAYFRRDEYPSTTAGTYNLSVRHSDTIQGEIQGGHRQRQGRCCYGGGGGQGYQG